MKKIPVTRSFMPPFEEYCDMIRPLWESRCLTNMAALHNKFKEELVAYLKVDNVALFTNGHLGLELALEALQLSGEVITTPFTFASTTHAIVRSGLTPVFCDICEEDYTLDAEKLESLITEKTSAILPVHVYGNPCNTEDIESIAKKYQLKVVYDAAHAFGVTYNGRGIGSYGDASLFSFHATKLFHTIEGGAVTFSNVALGDELYNLKNFGIRSPEQVVGVGMNAKMSEFQAAMGLCNLHYIDEVVAERKRVAERYCTRLASKKGLQSSCWKANVQTEKRNYAYFPLLVDEAMFGISRDALVEALNEAGIYPRKYFYPLTSAYDCYKGQFDSFPTPVAQRVAEQVLTLPIYPELANSDVDRICDVILHSR